MGALVALPELVALPGHDDAEEKKQTLVTLSQQPMAPAVAQDAQSVSR